MSDVIETDTIPCKGAGCPNPAGSLQCPTCQKQGRASFFCSQECFKANWATHRLSHKQTIATFDPFSLKKPYKYTGSLRPVYPLSARRTIPDRIPKPDYADTGIPVSEQKFVGRNKITILDKKQQDAMRKVCRLAREVLDIAARAAKPGVTTDYIDEVVHNACIERESYPSPLNYCNFPKSVCTSVNEVICHGIPDNYILKDGDILNIDVTLYHQGYHGDINETYYIGSLASSDPDSVRVVETARQCLDLAIAQCQPGTPYRKYGDIIDKHAQSRGCSTVKTYCGHGINTLFHCAPTIPHYAKNKAVGEAKPGTCFTIEPMICLGKSKDRTWPDNWTSVTEDGSRSAQFEHTLLVTETGVEVLTARLPDSPGGPVIEPVKMDGQTEPSSANTSEVKDTAPINSTRTIPPASPVATTPVTSTANILGTTTIKDTNMSD